MGSKFFEELSRCLGKEQIESLSKEDRRLEIFLHGQPVLSVSPGNEVFMLPSGSKNPEANELYHRVAIAADRVFEYVEAMENTPLLRARGLDNKFHLLADFGGAVLAGRERGTGRGYEFVTWIWDYERVGVSHGHYYEDDFAGAKRDFAVRSGLIPKASLFSNEELTEIYWATETGTAAGRDGAWIRCKSRRRLSVRPASNGIKPPLRIWKGGILNTQANDHRTRASGFNIHRLS